MGGLGRLYGGGLRTGARRRSRLRRCPQPEAAGAPAAQKEARLRSQGQKAKGLWVWPPQAPEPLPREGR